MKSDKMALQDNYKKGQNLFVRTILIITIMAFLTYIIMLWISPESKNLSKFLLGFGISFASIVLFAYYIKYISELYKAIRKKKK